MATIDSPTTPWNDGSGCRVQGTARIEIQRPNTMDNKNLMNNTVMPSILGQCTGSASDHRQATVSSSTKIHSTISLSEGDESFERQSLVNESIDSIVNDLGAIQLNRQQSTELKEKQTETTDGGSSSSSSSVCDISKCSQTAGILRNPNHASVAKSNTSTIITNTNTTTTTTDSISTNSSTIIQSTTKINSSTTNYSTTTTTTTTNTITTMAKPNNFLSLYAPSQLSKHIRNLSKTQSLDLTTDDDRTDESSKSSDLSTVCHGILMPKLQSLDQQSPTSSTPSSSTPTSSSTANRPIYPNVPYSPYGSPYGSPRSGRRRPPLRESRRISIEQGTGFLQLNQYKLMDQIGQGSYGLVKLAYSDEDSTHYAMKILSKRKLLRKAGLMGRGPKKGLSPLDRVYREIAVLKKLDHPNVVKLVEVLDDPLEDSLYLVFELVQQGEVLSIPTETPLKEDRAWSVFRDALQGLEYLHYQRIIHGDIKPGNLLLGECGSVKIADLGVCNEFFGEDASMNNGSTAGTPAFRAPETLQIGQHSYSGKASDIWALGATLYALVFGRVPFLANNVPQVYEKIKNDPLKFPKSPIISQELIDLIEKMLSKDPAQRYTLPQIKEHNWVTANGTALLKSEEENCRLVQINDDDINSVVKSIPKLDTLILIKTMLKKHSFLNPFLKGGGISGRAPMRGGSRLERFTRAGRSNSAPGAYHMIDRQMSSDNILPSVNESESSSCSSFDTNDGC